METQDKYFQGNKPGGSTVDAARIPDLAPPDVPDPVVEVYKKDVDRTLLRENLRLSVEQRLQKFVAFMRDLDELREAGRRMRESTRTKAVSNMQVLHGTH